MHPPFNKIDHGTLVKRAVHWLQRQRRCSVVLTDLRPLMAIEVPDAIGWQWNISESILIECKASRSNFLIERYKPSRRREFAHCSLGTHRYYMTPENLIRPSEMPPRWGLLEVRGTRVFVVKKAERWKSDEGARAHRLTYEGNLLLSLLKKYQRAERMAGLVLEPEAV